MGAGLQQVHVIAVRSDGDKAPTISAAGKQASLGVEAEGGERLPGRFLLRLLLRPAGAGAELEDRRRPEGPDHARVGGRDGGFGERGDDILLAHSLLVQRRKLDRHRKCHCCQIQYCS